MSRRCLIIASPAVAARPRLLARCRQWREQLQRAGVSAEATAARDPNHARALARAAAAAGMEQVIAAGGDGTTRAVAGGMLEAEAAETVLGLVPLGTGNDLADLLGLRHEAAATAALLEGRVRRLDVIEVLTPAAPARPRQFALLFAAVGFAPVLLACTGPRLKRWLGRSGCYSAGFFRALVRFRAPWLAVRADGRVREGRFFHVCAGNSERAGGGVMRLSPGARPDDGRLELCLIEALSRWEALWNFPRLLRGTFPGHPRVSYHPGRELVVESARPVPLALDGDVVGTTPARFQVWPGALRVLVPPAASSE